MEYQHYRSQIDNTFIMKNPLPLFAYKKFKIVKKHLKRKIIMFYVQFYSHQVSLYVFCCVGMNSKNPTFYTWTEVEAGRGSNQLGSALLHYLDSLQLEKIEVLRLFCADCGGQNKYSHIVHALYFWLQNKSPRTLKALQLTFRARGHSFLPADRVFGSVEKCLRTNTTIISKEEYVEMYSQFGTVQQLGVDWTLYDIRKIKIV
ncbi:hypothetical protein HUJ04_001504 [Dendroctonus ponderosae]|nr:hypothetical protein HUJ04_001504 [Dendroctonus ponderosae]KAH1017044.1 hypothetical protein HUJ05_007772 [Dendroctonus ponderosae]